MLLTSLHLRNWRSYRNATLSFPAPDRAGRRNVILVGAQNGVGKTSILMGLYLGLFGRESMDLIEGFRTRRYEEDAMKSYKKLMESILHRPALAQDEPHCSVSLCFGTGDEATVITRRWNFFSGGRARDLNTRDGEEVLIETNGRKKAYNTWQEANARIQEEIFPANVMPCFFFDGEQAQERVEAAGGRALFDAVKALYGTGILDQLGESLKHYIANERAALQRDVGVVRLDELEQRRAELDRKKDELRRIQDSLAIARKTRSAAETRRAALEQQLYSMVGDKAADVEEYAGTVAALLEEEAKLKQDLIAGIGSLALPMAVQHQATALRQVLDAEQIRDRWLILKDEASGKAATIVEQVLPTEGNPRIAPPLTSAQTEQLRASLEKALEALWSPPPEGCADRFAFPFLQHADRAGILSKIDRLGDVGSGNLSETALELQSVDARLRETRNRYERIKDIQPQLQQIRSDLQAALDEQREAGNHVGGFEHQERGIQQEINDLRGAIGQMEKRQEALNPVQNKLEVAQRVRTLVDEAKEQLVPLCKEALEERCTVHFRQMVSNEYARFRARFEADSEPWLEGPSGQVILVSSLSGAQKRAFGLAFTLAVADVSQQEAPIVIDTPVGNMDSEYRSRILRYVADAASGQVIILSHDEEVYGPYVQVLSPKIRKTYLVEFEPAGDGSGVSTVREDAYFS